MALFPSVLLLSVALLALALGGVQADRDKKGAKQVTDKQPEKLQALDEERTSASDDERVLASDNVAPLLPRLAHDGILAEVHSHGEVTFGPAEAPSEKKDLHGPIVPMALILEKGQDFISEDMAKNNIPSDDERVLASENVAPLPPRFAHDGILAEVDSHGDVLSGPTEALSEKKDLHGPIVPMAHILEKGQDFISEDMAENGIPEPLQQATLILTGTTLMVHESSPSSAGIKDTITDILTNRTVGENIHAALHHFKHYLHSPNVFTNNFYLGMKSFLPPPGKRPFWGHTTLKLATWTDHILETWSAEKTRAKKKILETWSDEKSWFSPLAQFPSVKAWLEKDLYDTSGHWNRSEPAWLKDYAGSANLSECLSEYVDWEHFQGCTVLYGLHERMSFKLGFSVIHALMKFFSVLRNALLFFLGLIASFIGAVVMAVVFGSVGTVVAAAGAGAAAVAGAAGAAGGLAAGGAAAVAGAAGVAGGAVAGGVGAAGGLAATAGGAVLQAAGAVAATQAAAPVVAAGGAAFNAAGAVAATTGAAQAAAAAAHAAGLLGGAAAQGVGAVAHGIVHVMPGLMAKVMGVTLHFFNALCHSIISWISSMIDTPFFHLIMQVLHKGWEMTFANYYNLPFDEVTYKFIENILTSAPFTIPEYLREEIPWVENFMSKTVPEAFASATAKGYHFFSETVPEAMEQGKQIMFGGTRQNTYHEV